MNPIPPIGPVSKVAGIQPTGPNVNAKKTDGPNVFEGFIAQTNLDQKNSDQAVKNLLDGTGSVQQVVMSVAKAEMSFKLFMEIRNKLIESYNELMRMQF